jgi:hypothetical protein
MVVTQEALHSLVQGREWDQLSLCLTADVMVFTTTGVWKTVESVFPPPKHTGKPAAPYIHHLTEGKKTDLTIACQGNKVFFAHALLLKCVSPVFERMLEAGMTTEAERHLVLQDVYQNTVEQMLEFIYTGSVSKNSAPLYTNELIDLLQCADKYSIDELKTEVLHLIKASLAVENAIKFFSAVKLYAAGEEGQRVASEILDFCIRNLAKFKKDSDLKNFLMQNWDAFV